MPVERLAARVVGGSILAHDLPDGTVWGDVVKEVRNRKGEDRVGMRKSWEAYLGPARITRSNTSSTATTGRSINGLELTRAGLVLMSLRTTSGVIGVDKKSGRSWRLRIPFPHDIVTQQHTPVKLDNGNILIFDNGNLRLGEAHRLPRAVIEVDPQDRARSYWEYFGRDAADLLLALHGRGAAPAATATRPSPESATGRHPTEVTRDRQTSS